MSLTALLRSTPTTGHVATSPDTSIIRPWMSHEQIAAEEHEALVPRSTRRSSIGGASVAAVGGRARADRPLGLRRGRGEPGQDLRPASDPLDRPDLWRVAPRPPSCRRSRTIARPPPAPRGHDRRAGLRCLSSLGAPAVIPRLGGPSVKGWRATAITPGSPRGVPSRQPMTYEVRPLGARARRAAGAPTRPRFRIDPDHRRQPRPFSLGQTPVEGYVNCGFPQGGLPSCIGGRGRPARLSRADPASSRPPSKIRPGRGRGRTSAGARPAWRRCGGGESQGPRAAGNGWPQDVREVEASNAEAAELNRRAARRPAASRWTPPQTSPPTMPTPGVPGTTSGSATDTRRHPGRRGRRRDAGICRPACSSSCFAAGTPVRTIAGPRPIESIRTGDQVLSQAAATGAAGRPAGPDRPPQPARHDPSDCDRERRCRRGEPVPPILAGGRSAGPWPATCRPAMSSGLSPRVTDRRGRIGPDSARLQPRRRRFADLLRERSDAERTERRLSTTHPDDPPFDRIADPGDATS